MTDVVIRDVDDAVLQRLQRRAQSAGVTLEEYAAQLLQAGASRAGTYVATAALIDDLAAMRASQPPQTDDAAADVRDLRDGTDRGTRASHAA
jgi:plasmid stability protein